MSLVSFIFIIILSLPGNPLVLLSDKNRYDSDVSDFRKREALYTFIDFLSKQLGLLKIQEP
jgi:hypothetical protein